MKRVGKICLCLAGGLVWNAVLRAAEAPLADNPYAPIVTRNVFDIHPPPPVDPNKANAESLPKITPNGITSHFGHVQVLFKMAGPAKPGQPAKDQFYILSEGQAQDDVEVTKIDEAAGLVTFNNHGTIQELPLASTPASGPAATAQGGPGAGPRLDLPSLPGNAPGGGNIRPGSRFGRSGGYPTPQSSPESGPQVAPQFAPSSGISSGASSSAQPQNPLSADDQAVLLTRDHALAVAKGDPTAIIYPPTKYDAEAGVPSNVGPPSPPPVPDGSTAH